MNIYTSLNNRKYKNNNSFNIILADKDTETFRRVEKLTDKYNFINLSSCFAVNFIMEYEKVDLIIVSKKISDLSNIIKKANKRKISIYIIGKDIESPLNEKEIDNLILEEIEKKLVNKKNKQFNFKKYVSNLLNINKSRELIRNSNVKNNKNQVKDSAIAGEKENIKCKEEMSGKKTFKNNISNEEKDNINERKKELELSKNVNLSIFPGKNNLSKDNRIDRIKTIKQKIITLSKAKGGVGSTTISIFLSFIFNKVKILLVDLNFSEGGGDLSYYLDIPKAPNILNFINGYNRQSLENSVIKVKENLDVLQTPPTYEMSKKIDLQDIYCLADIAKKKYHLIIFDLPNKLDDLLLGVIDLADLLIMVSDNTLGSIGRLLKINNRFVCGDIEKILIINKYSKLNGVNLIKNKIGQFFHLNSFVFLDEDEILRNKSEFSNFNFSNLESFNYLTEKIFDLLTYE